MSPKELSDARSRFVDIAEGLRKFNRKERTKWGISIKAVEARLITLQADKDLVGLLSAAFTALDMGRTDDAAICVKRATAFADAALAGDNKPMRSSTAGGKDV